MTSSCWRSAVMLSTVLFTSSVFASYDPPKRILVSGCGSVGARGWYYRAVKVKKNDGKLHDAVIFDETDNEYNVLYVRGVNVRPNNTNRNDKTELVAKGNVVIDLTSPPSYQNDSYRMYCWARKQKWQIKSLEYGTLQYAVNYWNAMSPPSTTATRKWFVKNGASPAPKLDIKHDYDTLQTKEIEKVVDVPQDEPKVDVDLRHKTIQLGRKPLATTATASGITSPTTHSTNAYTIRRRRLAATPYDLLSPAEQVIKRFHATQRQQPHIARLEKLLDEMSDLP